MGIEKMSQLSIEGDLSQIERALMICCDRRRTSSKCEGARNWPCFSMIRIISSCFLRTN